MMKPSSALKSAQQRGPPQCHARSRAEIARPGAELLLHLGEVDERKLYLECASLDVRVLLEELVSEDAAYARITVARAARRFAGHGGDRPSGQVQLTDCACWCHISPTRTIAKSWRRQRQIEATRRRVVARLSPQPAVPALIRKLPELPAPATVPPPLARENRHQSHGHRRALPSRGACARTADGKTFKVQFTPAAHFGTSCGRRRTCSGTAYRTETSRPFWKEHSIS